MTSVPECVSCGACCFSRLATYVRVTGADHERLRERVEDLVDFDGHRAYMRMADGHCAALAIDTRTRRFTCTVYEARPQACRDLARGLGACAAEIALKGDRPLALLGRKSPVEQD